MKIKVLLDYDTETNAITAPDNCYIGTYVGLVAHEPTTEGVSIAALVELKEAGFEVNEITELRKKGII